MAQRLARRERLQIKHHSAVGLADRLVAEKHIRRVPDKHDRRQVRLALTSRGELVLRQLSTAHQEQLQRLGPQFDQLLELLRGRKSPGDSAK